MNRSMAFSWMLVLILTTIAKAQVPGDWNGDGVISGADLPGLNACMLGPNVMASTTCAGLYPGMSNIGVQLAIYLQAANARGSSCLRWSSPSAAVTFPLQYGLKRGKAMIQLEYPGSSLYGCQATIDTYHTPTLCLQPNGAFTAFSVRWVGIAGRTTVVPSFPLWWIQGGIATRRRWANPTPPATTTILQNTYSELFDETISTNGISHWSVTFSPAPPLSAEYHVQLNNQGSPRRAYWIEDGIVIRIVSNPTLPVSDGADLAHWAGETLNVADFMAGSRTNPCRFRDCAWELGVPGNVIPVELFGDEDFVTPFYLYGLDFVGTTGFNIYDLW